MNLYDELKSMEPYVFFSLINIPPIIDKFTMSIIYGIIFFIRALQICNTWTNIIEVTRSWCWNPRILTLLVVAFMCSQCGGRPVFRLKVLLVRAMIGPWVLGHMMVLSDPLGSICVIVCFLSNPIRSSFVKVCACFLIPRVNLCIHPHSVN